MESYNYRMFGCFNRKFKINDAEPPPDVRHLFAKYSNNGSDMSADQLLSFLIEFQGEEGCTISDAERTMKQILHQRHHLTTYARHALTLDDFFHFLFSDDLNGPIKSQVHNDMTAPLQHYFVYTGHNSYLTGNQLSSDCSEIPIIKALERGVRVIELDLWPNSAKDGVHVLHGRTLTTPVPLLKCLKSIKEHAFVKSPYPVIITLEDHLTPDLQAKVAEMIIQTFGEMLYYPESECFKELPSPESLKHHIIVSTKPPKEYLEAKHAKLSIERDSSEDELLGKETLEELLGKKSLKEDLTPEPEADRSNSDQDDDEGNDCNQKSSQLGARKYRRLSATKDGLKNVLTADRSGSDHEDNNVDVYNQNSSQLGAPKYKRLSATKDVLKNALDLTAEPEADRSGSDHEDDGVDVCNQNSSQLGAPKYKRLSATKDVLKNALDPTAEPETNRSGSDHEDDEVDVCNQNSSQLGSPKYKRLSAAKDVLKNALDLTAEPEADRSFSDRDDDEVDIGNQKSPQLGAPKYKRLIAIHAGKPKNGLRNALALENDTVKRLSLSEQELEKAATSYGTSVVRFTQKNILRVYPKGTRVNSSNFNPVTGWMHGAQMVACNMQGYGKSLWLMHGMFRANGGCGYVKKPDFLFKKSSHDEVFDPKAKLRVKKILKLTVYMGDGWRLDFSHTHFDLYSPPDFYTKIYILGVPADVTKKKTRIIEDEWRPIWDEEFVFPLRVPELALLRIEVREYDMSEKDDFGGQTCLPVSELRPGIRAVPLYDKKGEKLRSVRLLVQFQFV